MRTLSIARLSLRRMTRDRSAMFFVILLPFFIILIIGSATKNFATSSAPVGLVVSSSGPRTDELVRAIEHTKNVRISRIENVTKLRAALRRGLYAGGVVVPKGYEEDVSSGRTADVDFIADQARGPSAVQTAIQASVAREGAIVQAADFASANLRFGRSLSQARTVAKFMPPVGVKVETLGKAPKRSFIMAGFEYTAPSQMILFVFITALAGSGMIILNRQQGITRRMYSTPATARTIVIGETLARFVIAAFQALFIVVLGVVIFGVNFGNPIAAGVLILMFVLVATSVAVLAGTVFRTPEQAGAVGPALGIAVGMLAGCMWPRFIMPLPMQRLGQLFPHAWAMDAFIKLIARGDGIVGILPQLGVLALYVAVLLPIATWRLRRSIVS